MCAYYYTILCRLARGHRSSGHMVKYEVDYALDYGQHIARPLNFLHTLYCNGHDSAIHHVHAHAQNKTFCVIKQQ